MCVRERERGKGANASRAYQTPVSPAICLSACMSASPSDISISQQRVPETLRHLFLQPANQMQGGGGWDGEIEEGKETKKASRRKDMRGGKDGWIH